MRVGCLGDIVFEVSDSVLKTIREASWSGSATVQTHQRHLMPGLTEFVSSNPDTFDFKLRVSRYLGSDPLADIEKLTAYERAGTALTLTIGTKSYGRYKWLITKHKISLEHFDKRGNLVGADITITLTEYIKE